jgi:hypothetical protein
MYLEHLFACLWFFLGRYGNVHNENNWLLAKDLINEDWKLQYLYSFYYSSVTMFTIGYGDITPQSNKDSLLYPI